MMRLTIALALFGGLAAVPATALAMEPYLPRSEKSFGRLDADSNGKVTPAEIAPRAEEAEEPTAMPPPIPERPTAKAAPM